MTAPAPADTTGDRLLSRRIFVAAVALLVVNDWFLKGADLVPGWLTGKLSDVAGMLVAPVVLGALLAWVWVPVALARVLACAAVAGVFVAIKLAPELAARFDALTNSGVSALSLPLVAQTVPDRTDLVVLPLLGLGAWMAGRLAADRVLRRSGALLAGVLACAATSPSQIRLDPHWGFARSDLGRLWGARLTAGAVIVQLGRQSADGAFEIGVELAAREGDLALMARDVVLEVPDERIAAQVPDGHATTVRAARGETVFVRYVFRPRTASWPKGTGGVLELTITDGEQRRPLRVDLSFEERIVPWRGGTGLR